MTKEQIQKLTKENVELKKELSKTKIEANNRINTAQNHIDYLFERVRVKDRNIVWLIERIYNSTAKDFKKPTYEKFPVDPIDSIFGDLEL